MDASFQRIGESAERRKLFEQMLRERGRSSGGSRAIIPARRVRSPCPVSYAQQRLWFIDQLGEGGGAAYHICGAVRLLGMLDREALIEGLDIIVTRHEVLRTVFASTASDPVQVIVETARFSLQEVDLSAHDAVEREAQVQSIRQEEAHARFDLTTGPLIRGRLLRLSAQEHVLLLTMHHIISDGWSMRILISELGQLYVDARQGRGNPLPPLPLQYADFAIWQREWLRGEALERQLAFWKDHLHGAPALLELPADRPRPSSQSYRGDSVKLTIAAQVSNQLRALARKHRTTLFVALQSAFVLLLSRLSGQYDVVVGVPVANRQRTEIEPLIGFFVNTLAMRTRLSEEASVLAVLEQVKETTLAAYENQDVPFERVVEAVHPPRTLSHSPVFQAMLVLQNMPASEARLPGFTLSPVPLWNDTEKFDLTVSLQESADEIVGTFGYATDLFDRSTIERWVEHFQTLLAGMVADPERQAGAIPLLSERQRRRIISKFNATRVEYSPDTVVKELFEEQARRAPDAVALVYEDQPLAYGQLNRDANQLAHYLRKQGVGPDQRVGLCVERSLSMATGLLGILKAGGAYVPLDPSYPQARLDYMMKDAAPRAVLTQRATKARVKGGAAVVIDLEDDWSAIAREPVEDISSRELRLTPRHAGYVIYTSGSTGQPKGVSLPQRALVNLVRWHTRKVSGVRRILQFASLSFDVSFLEFFAAWAGGGTVVVPAQELRYDPVALTRFIHEQTVDMAIFPVTVLRQIAEHCAGKVDRLAHLRDVVATGEQLKISPAIQRLFERLPACRLHNYYGPTEAHVVTELTLDEAPDRWPSYPPIGRPIDNTQIYILDAFRQPVPIGVTGAIFIAGACVASGYLNRPELTAERFVDDPFSDDETARMYQTGDLGRWQAEGLIEYLGRNDHQVKIRGQRVELGEIEAQLSRHEHVGEAVVILREDGAGERRLVAYFTDKQGTTTSEALKSHLRACLPEHMIPSAFMRLQAVPLTPNGKVDRKALERLAVVDCAPDSYEAPVGEFEEALAAIWQELLNVERVGRHDNFFDLGGHSMLTATLIGRLQQVGLVASLATVFKHPTLKSLAECLEMGLDQELVPNPILLREEGKGTPLFLVHEVSGDVLPYLPLARALRRGFPVYGLQRLGIWHLRSLEELAAEHIAAIRRVQPKGPYRLAGWSLGAAIAYEMAYQLIGADETVEFLGMIDSFAPTGRSRPDSDDIEVLNRFIRHRFSKTLQPEEVEELAQLNDVARFLEVAKARKYAPDHITLEDMHRIIKNRRLIPELVHRYDPASLPLTVHFFDAADLPSGVSRDWETLIGRRVRRQVIGGTHLTIMQPPHLQQLAEVMSQALEDTARNRPVAPEYSPLVPIQTRGPTHPSVFCIPGAGASIGCFLPLAQALGDGFNVYGLQPRGLDEPLVPHSTVTATAMFYVEAVRKISPAGPYHLLGHSYGGWVAFEMARLLGEEGQEVATVFVLDSDAPRGQRQAYSRVELVMHLSETLEEGASCTLGLTAQELRPLDNRAQVELLLRRMIGAGILPAEASTDTVQRILRVFASNLNTVYQPPAPARAALALVQPEYSDSADLTRERQESVEEWRKHSSRMSLFKTAGNHMSLLKSPHVDYVAEQIKRLWS